MKRVVFALLFTITLSAFVHLRADQANVHLRIDGTNALIQIEGDDDDDWRLQCSSNLTTWNTLTNFGTLLSGSTSNAPWRASGATPTPGQFYRAVKTAGLFDPTLFRTVNLTFTQANWSQMMTSGRTYETNVPCTVFLDNGATNFGVGARYKGNTSYTMSGTKKSINMEFDWKDTNADLMTYQTVNLNNAFGDYTIMREALYFDVMSQYTPCPQGAMARVYINGGLWGVYSLVQQENSQLIKQWFPSANGDRWRAPNAPGGGGGGGPGGGFVSSNSAFAYFGTNINSYTNKYELKTDNSPKATAWQRLVDAIGVLNTTPTNQLRDVAENSWALDNWLWFLAIENIFADDDSYWNKGADYGFYYELESGRIHPVEHDGNEAFTAGDTALSPVFGASSTNRPLLYRLLPINELRQRYLAHMRTVLQEYYNPQTMTPMANAFHSLSINAIIADPNKSFTMVQYTNDLIALKTWITNRHNFLTTHAELTPLQPNILTVNGPNSPPTPSQVATITAQVQSTGGNGIDSVWLYYRSHSYGRFTAVQMFDDGGHGDGASGDGIFGAATASFPAGTKVRYYVEARAANPVRAAAFSPPHAENQTYNYRVALTTANNSPVIINEFMASNSSTLADPQGDYDDWIELHNVTDQEVDLTGRYLSDETGNLRKWPFPPGTKIPADSYLLIWADEDTSATPGLHASFKLSGSGEQIYLVDTDANLNVVLDSIVFDAQQTDRSYGRTAADADVWAIMNPTPGAANQ